MKHLVRGAVFGLLVVVIWGCDPDKTDYDDSEDLNDTVISCEVAIAHLANCCPEFDPQKHGQCTDRDYHQTSGCESVTTKAGRTLPEMTLEESVCVRESSCESLVNRGVCNVVMTNGPRGKWSYDYRFNADNVHESNSGVYEHATVCL
jgi:hypothetical protein